MSKLDQAVDRLSAALAAVERGLSETGGPNGAKKAAAKAKALEGERDRLAAEVERLEQQVAEDAALRAEAADAVRAALGDLKAVTRSEQERGHG